MKTLALIAVMSSAAMAQTASVPAAGVWTGQFAGQTFVRLELRATGGAMTGGISLGDIEVDKQGALQHAAASPRSLTPIFDVVQHGGILTFSRKDGTDTDRFEFRMLDDGHAGLQVLLSDADMKELAAAGIPRMQPFLLTRQ